MNSARVPAFATIAAALALFLAPHDASFTVQLHAEHGSGQDGSATFIPYGDGTLVIVSLQRWTPGSLQPAHIHPGACGRFALAPLFPLSALYDGRSATFVPYAPDLIRARASILEIHASQADLTGFVACGRVR